MLRAIKNKLRPLYYRLFERGKLGYLQKRERCGYAPYNLELYTKLMEQLQNHPDINLLSFNDNHTQNDKVNVYLRHDIDTIDCMRNMPQLLDINLVHGIEVGVYFRVDDDEYRLQEHRDVVKAYKEKGIEMGLHTVFWERDDFMEAFKEETEKFEGEAGFRPLSFTVHGSGNYRKDVKEKFYSQIERRWGEFGYECTDCHPQFRRYHYVIEDCHWDEEIQQRFIYRDFEKLPDFLEKGKIYLILTHPCYWK